MDELEQRTRDNQQIIYDLTTLHQQNQKGIQELQAQNQQLNSLLKSHLNVINDWWTKDKQANKLKKNVEMRTRHEISKLMTEI